MTVDGHTVRLVPLRVGTKAVGLLAASGRTVEPGTLDALAGVVAIAIERVQLLDERHAAEMARQSEALKSALLASLGHDLRTPLTAIRVAASNLQASWLGESDRREQSDLILVEVERLNRLFQNILEMARLEAGGVIADLQWAHPSEIVEAALDQVEHTLRHHPIDLDAESELLVRVDPRLTASALAHLLENAGQYSPLGSPIAVRVTVSSEELLIRVRDRGPGIDPVDLSHLFERFYRGREAKQRASGMGLAICRGVLSAEGKIYRPEKIEQALTNFFRKGNLSALRELALRAVADEVAEKAASYRTGQGLQPALMPERVMVCMSSSVLAPRVIRTGARIAGRLGARWYAVYVETPRERPDRIAPQDSAALDQNVSLAQNLGATVVRVHAERPAEGLIAFAQREGITHVIFGQSARSRWELLRHGSTTDRFLSAVRDAAVQVVPLDEHG
jgi:K+-sensing histidine kinase KdpD